VLRPAAHTEIARCVAAYLVAHPGEEKRLLKAVQLVKGGWVVPCSDEPGAVFVRSLKTGRPYRVGARRCECKDSRTGRACKHRLARRLYFVARAADALVEKGAALSRGIYDAASYVRSGAHAAACEEHEIRCYAEPEIDYSAGQEAPEYEPALDTWDAAAEDDFDPEPPTPPAAPAAVLPPPEEDLYERAARERREAARARRAAEDAAFRAREAEQLRLLSAWRAAAPQVLH
jgi:hypothetical protein